MIGPNAVLQLLPLLDRLGGPDRRARMLAEAGIFEVPSGQSMIPETSAARLHQQLRLEEPVLAAGISARAGFETANYILAHRIPRAAQLLLKVLPEGPSAFLLAAAISKHAWTFVGSGDFRILDPWNFEITGNPLILGERSEFCLCHWHTAVFERLYQFLVAPSCKCVETECGAQGPDHKCCFKLER
ncbi:bacteriochlorophyll 4-vinyl reductase [Sulfitobacter sediminis]|uniref:bacteriochlorophyll 4-vinyl reductase n=1 Tax=Sulfitobacter sediminis TaxID=3234186 RepID=UPI003B21F9FD